MLPRTKPYVRWQAKALKKLGITKSLRSDAAQAGLASTQLTAYITLFTE